jgi:anthranilate synthase component 2
MNILVLDNYDSFVYNLVHVLRRLDGVQVNVVRNDDFDLLDSFDCHDKILLSPGPGIPSEAGRMMELVRRFASRKSILGICLGHQAIAECFGATLSNLAKPLHGVTSTVTRTGEDYLFEKTPEQFIVGHYHSWAVDGPLPDTLEVTATASGGMIMALRHRQYDVRGLQFHPESILTEHGETILKNWVYQQPA